ncbi:MAG: US12 family protein, partial [Opitutales bacterium]|nr:US12 family protein [Opitutales bacterium]
MNDYTNPFVVAAAAPATRADFYRKTYMLVAVACAVFGLLLAGTLATPAIVNPLTRLFFGSGGFGWLLVLGGFWLISMFANRLAFGGVSTGTQLTGLGVYIVAEVLLFAPMLNLLMIQFGQDAMISEIVAPAALSTILLECGLTATVFMTKTDFSFL